MSEWQTPVDTIMVQLAQFEEAAKTVISGERQEDRTKRLHANRGKRRRLKQKLKTLQHVKPYVLKVCRAA